MLRTFARALVAKPSLPGTVSHDIAAELAKIRAEGRWKRERHLASPQDTSIVATPPGGQVVNLCANNYLGLANDPRVKAAAREAIDSLGYGMASVRFICGTQAAHISLEGELASFHGTAASILFSSCWDANGGLFETVLQQGDAVISDELNHASIIDGIRLCRAKRYVYPNRSMDGLRKALASAKADGARRILVSTDGVFSMDGTVAPLRDILDAAEAHGAMVHVDDSHATGVLGATGRGTSEHWGVDPTRIAFLTSTLGKALGGGSGGYLTSPHEEVIELMRQRARPYLFSNSLPPPIVAAARTAISMLSADPSRTRSLQEKARKFRKDLTAAGLVVPEGDTPIVPVMVGDAAVAAAMADAMLTRGFYCVAFSFPVVAVGKARIRTQVCASHTVEQLDAAVRAFAEVWAAHRPAPAAKM